MFCSNSFLIITAVNLPLNTGKIYLHLLLFYILSPLVKSKTSRKWMRPMRQRLNASFYPVFFSGGVLSFFSFNSIQFRSLKVVTILLKLLWVLSSGRLCFLVSLSGSGFDFMRSLTAVVSSKAMIIINKKGTINIPPRLVPPSFIFLSFLP